MTQSTRGGMTIDEIARAVKVAFLAWLKERTEHLFKIMRRNETITLLLANQRNQDLTNIQKNEITSFMNKLKETFGITPTLKKNTEKVVMWDLQLQ